MLTCVRDLFLGRSYTRCGHSAHCYCVDSTGAEEVADHSGCRHDNLFVCLLLVLNSNVKLVTYDYLRKVEIQRLRQNSTKFDKTRHYSTFCAFLTFLMRRSRCWWGCSSVFDKIDKTQHFSTFLDITLHFSTFLDASKSLLAGGTY